MRVIPKTAKVKVQFFKNITIADTIIALIGLAIIVVLFISNLGIPRFILMGITLIIFVSLFIPYDGERFYIFIVNFAKYLFSEKKYSKEVPMGQSNIEFFLPFKNISDGFIEYNEYFAGVLQIDPREFRLLSGFRQDQMIDNYFGSIVRSIAGNTKASIVKIDRKLSFEAYCELEEKKKDILYKLSDEGEMTRDELFSREKVIDDRIRIYKELNDETPITKPFYYLVVYDDNKNIIKEILDNAVKTFLEIGMTSHILDDKEIGIFLKYNYTNKFDEKERFLKKVI